MYPATQKICPKPEEGLSKIGWVPTNQEIIFCKKEIINPGEIHDK